MPKPSWSLKIPSGDDRERRVCNHCEFVDYQNPRIVSGAVVVSHASEILLARRAIQPQHGFWTLPAGYLELGETPAEGAIRETWEEAGATIEIDGMVGIYSVRHIGQVQFFYSATLKESGIAAGPESLEVAFFEPAQIPWDELAFSSVRWAIKQYLEHGSAPLPPDAVYAVEAR